MSAVRERPLRRRARGALLGHGTGDADAFHEFYVANRQRLVLFFARRTLDAEAARDLTSETFAVALQRRRQFRGHTDAEAEAWLFAIARTQLSQHWRRGTAERRALELVWSEAPTAHVPELERIEELAGVRQLVRRLRTAIAELSADQAYAIEQRVLCERDYDDLAAELGVSQDVVRARVSRGLRSLAESATAVLRAGAV